jgi:hypothetical protein
LDLRNDDGNIILFATLRAAKNEIERLKKEGHKRLLITFSDSSRLPRDQSYSLVDVAGTVRHFDPNISER